MNGTNCKNRTKQIRISQGFIFTISVKKGSKALKFCKNIVFISAFYATSRKLQKLILVKIRENKVLLVAHIVSDFFKRDT